MQCARPRADVSKGIKQNVAAAQNFPARGCWARLTGMYVLCVRADTTASCCPLTILRLPEHFQPRETLLIIKTRISTLYTPEINHSHILTKTHVKVACLWKINCYGSIKEINNLRIFIHLLTQVESSLQPFSPIIKHLLDLAQIFNPCCPSDRSERWWRFHLKSLGGFSSNL